MKLSGIFAVCLFLVVTTSADRTVDHHLTDNDFLRFQKVFADGLKSDLQSIYYSAKNSKTSPAKDKQEVCSRLVSVHKDSKLNDFEKNFYLVATHKLFECTEKIPSAVLDAVTAAVNKETTTVHELFYNFFSFKNVDGTLDDVKKAKIAKNLQTILKKDDSLSSLGHAFYIASELGSHGAFAFNRVEDAIVQADEVDGKMLQFEGGLSITALLINGIFKITKAMNKPTPINTVQAVKFSTYFLSRRTVQTAKGVSILLDALTTITNDKAIAPISINVISKQISPDNQVLNVKVCDLLGNALSPALAALSTTITAKQSNQALLSKVNLVPSRTDNTLFTYDLKSAKPARGQYKVDIDVNGVYKQSLPINVLGRVSVKSLEIGVGDSDSTTAVKTTEVTYPKKLNHELKADSQQKILLKALLVDEVSQKPMSVHQAFVRLNHKATNKEIIFVAEQDSSKAYKFDMDFGSRSGDFNFVSGDYVIELIVGDASLSNSFKWHVADIQLKFTQGSQSETSSPTRAPREEIVHQFRQPEKRPPRFVSDVFTLLCAAPLLILFILWAKLRINVSNFPFCFSALGFHLGLGAILSLFGIFWLKLNMFDTVRYLIPLGLVTFIAGNKLLRHIASKRMQEK